MGRTSGSGVGTGAPGRITPGIVAKGRAVETGRGAIVGMGTVLGSASVLGTSGGAAGSGMRLGIGPTSGRTVSTGNASGDGSASGEASALGEGTAGSVGNGPRVGSTGAAALGLGAAVQATDAMSAMTTSGRKPNLPTTERASHRPTDRAETYTGRSGGAECIGLFDQSGDLSLGWF